jgi:hypothetical protein
MKLKINQLRVFLLALSCLLVITFTLIGDQFCFFWNLNNSPLDESLRINTDINFDSFSERFLNVVWVHKELIEIIHFQALIVLIRINIERELIVF